LVLAGSEEKTMFSKKPKPPQTPSNDSLGMAANASSELKRVTVNPSGGLPPDSAVIPNIEAWLKGRSGTETREILKNPFDDSVYRG
jgi:hypothetical protein